VWKNCVKDFSVFLHKEITDTVLNESEREVIFTEKLTSATFEPLRNGAFQIVREIVFQFDIRIATMHKI
jgi:hypothetical protein